MLSDFSKELLESAVEGTKLHFGIEALQEHGPKVLIDETIDCANISGRKDVVDNLNQNKKEAEQFLAGLIGMM